MSIRSLFKTTIGIFPFLIIVAVPAFLQAQQKPLPYTYKKSTPSETKVQCDNLTLVSSLDENRFTFIGNVSIKGDSLDVTCDNMTVVSKKNVTDTGSVGKIGKIEYILAIGNVKIIQGSRVAMAGRAQILPLESKVILENSPTVIDGGSVVTGYRMILLKGEKKAIVEGGPDGERPSVSLPDIPDLGY